MTYTGISADGTIILDDGDSPILSYNLQYADKYSGDYIDVIGGDDTNANSLRTIYTVTNLAQGETYLFRFRVRNQIGWSDYSPVTE